MRSPSYVTHRELGVIFPPNLGACHATGHTRRLDLTTIIVLLTKGGREGGREGGGREGEREHARTYARTHAREVAD